MPPVDRGLPLDPRIGLLAVIAAALLAGANTLQGQFVWDDVLLVPANTYANHPPLLTGFHLGAVATGYFRPVVSLFFIADSLLWAQRPFGYHLTNVVLHAAAAALVFQLIRLLRGGPAAALLGGLLFAVHPVHSEAVAFVSGRSDLACTLFSLTAICLFAVLSKSNPGRAALMTVAVPVASLLALGGKEMAATLPALMPLLSASPRVASWNRAQKTALASSLIAVLVYLGYRQSLFGGLPLTEAATAPLTQRLLGIPLSLWTYLRLMVLPWPLHPYYIVPTVKSAFSGAFLLPFAGVLLTAALAALSGGSVRRLFAAGVIALLPVLNIVPIGSADIAERYVYLPSAFFLAALALAAERAGLLRGRRLILPAGLLLVLLALTVVQNRTWKDEATLWRTAIEKSPRSGVAHFSYGLYLEKAGDLAGALREYRTVIILEPKLPEIYISAARVVEALGRADEALDLLRTAELVNPNNWKSRLELGAALFRRGRNAESILHYREGLGIKPDSANLHNNLGVALEASGRFDEALVHYREAVRRDPNYADARINLGTALSASGDENAGIRELREALRLDPDNPDALNNLGIALETGGDQAEATRLFREALRARPDFPQARENLARILAATTGR